MGFSPLSEKTPTGFNWHVMFGWFGIICGVLMVVGLIVKFVVFVCEDIKAREAFVQKYSIATNGENHLLRIEDPKTGISCYTWATVSKGSLDEARASCVKGL